jgi:cell division protein YceG involved in septum cleavage
MKLLTSPDEVIDHLGGTSKVAELTKRSPSAVSNWRAEGYLPPKTYYVMTGALASRGLAALPALWQQTLPTDAPPSREAAE